MSDEIFEPVIVDPPGFTPEQGWKDCRQSVEQCGGLTYPDGEVNWRAAFSADPGITSCPACQAKHWSWGRVVRCARCAFEFPTDWWPMYSYGVAEARRGNDVLGTGNDISVQRSLRELHRRRMAHAYYRYGYEHPVEDAWKERDKIDWRRLTGQQDEER